MELTWTERRRAPREMYRECDAVVDGNRVYFRDGVFTKTIYSYDATTDSWSQLPDCVTTHGSITVINGLLTTVGGVDSKDLWSLTGEGKHRKWTKIYLPMPTERSRTTALCTGTALIVAGGVGEGTVVLSTVEVMNTENHQWSTAADLPQPMYYASATVCGDHIYMLGGTVCFRTTKSVYRCSVNALLSDQASVWRQLADLPVTGSTCESFRGRLLAVGGEDNQILALGGRDDEPGIGTTAVYAYNSAGNPWEIISHMTTGRYRCFTAVLPNNQLMVVGGKTAPAFTDRVELAI